MQRLAAVLAASLLFALALGRDSSATAGPPAPQQPEVLSPVAPEYPSLARAARARGVVVVEVQVNADGSVASAQAMSGHPLLQRSAAGAASRWRFKPGARAASARLTFDFRWEQAEEEVKPDSPYHLVVYRPQPPDTENRVPPDAEDQTCEVHGFKLERDKVSISYGLPAFDPVGAEALRTLFPHSNRRVGGGCEVTDDSQKFAEILYCRACRAAEERWIEEHRKEPKGEAADAPGGDVYVHRHH